MHSRKTVTSIMGRINSRKLGVGGLVLGSVSVLALAGGGVALASALASPVRGGVIHGCYRDRAFHGSHKIALQDAGTSCPNGTTSVSWDKSGSPGLTGITATSLTSVPVSPLMDPVTVMTSPAVPDSGDYYVTASINVYVDFQAIVVCFIQGAEGNDEAIGEADSNDNLNLSLVGVVPLSAGKTFSLVCEESHLPGNHTPNEAAFDSGTINAILVHHTAGPGLRSAIKSAKSESHAAAQFLARARIEADGTT